MTDVDDEAEFAVLTSAVREELGGEVPPDVLPAVLVRCGGEVAPVSAAPPRVGRPSRWFAAALVLFGIGVAAFFVVQGPPSVPTPAGAGDDGLRGGPVDLVDLQARAASTTGLTVRAVGGWSDELRRHVAWPRWALDDFMRPRLRSTLDDEDRDEVRAAIANARDGGPVVDHVWTHALRLAGPSTGTDVELRLVLGGDQEPVVAFCTPVGARRLLTPGFPGVDLRRELDDVARRTVAELGFVVGAGGFAAVPATAKRLGLIEVPAAAVGELARFTALEGIDLTRSPGWHAAPLLLALPATLTSLRLDGAAVAADGWRALGSRHALRELDLAPDVLGLLGGRPIPSPHPVAGLDDAALQALGGLVALRELALPAGAFGARGLAAIASLPALASLVLLDAGGRTDLAPLAGARVLTKLGLFGTWSPAALRSLARVATLRNVSLVLPAAGEAAALHALRDLRQLRRLEIVRQRGAGAPASDVELADLRAALPECRVTFDTW
jgi:hypothetical protein